ncbi:MAG: hypothetical protein IKE21_05670 [Erysipelotrichaceae bacterium]|nr:hypothetical protein [Erysipelotrichaceae bacterium]
MKKLVFLIIILLLLIGGISGFTWWKKQEIERLRTETVYLAADAPTLTLTSASGKETEFIRGTEIELRVHPPKDQTCRIFLYDEEEYCISEEITVREREDAVLDTDKYALYPSVIYEDRGNFRIAGSVSAGEQLQLLSHTPLQEDGSVEGWFVSNGETQGYLPSADLSDTQPQWEVPAVHAQRENDYDGGAPGDVIYPDFPVTVIDGNEMPREVRALYLNKVAAGEIDGYIELAQSSGINAFVIDLKESDGICYQSRAVQAYSPTSYDTAWLTWEEFADSVKKAKDAGIYLIGRIVTFKDLSYAQDYPEYTLQDRNTGQPFLLYNTYWPSPYQREVWEYNMALAVEAVDEFGFNEIQFDYVRFPDRISAVYDRIDFRNDRNETMIQAIQGFLFYAREVLHEHGAYLSADVFGECSNAYVTAYGQYWPMISNAADVISAMPYPDHFGMYSYGISQPVWEVPGQLLRRWGEDVVERQSETPSPAKVRTWLQGYDSNHEPYVEYTTDMIIEQINGLYANGLDDGYMIWNAPSNIIRYWRYVPAFEPHFAE